MTTWRIRLAVMLLFGLTAIFYAVALAPHVEFPAYYFITAACDLFLIVVLRFFRNCALTRDLQRLNLISIANQFFGFVIYMLYFPPTAYNVVLHTLQVLEWTRMITTMRDDKITRNDHRPTVWPRVFRDAVNRGAHQSSEASP